MSATFDTINRRHLLDIVKTIVDEDEHILIQFPLSGTVIDSRINGTSTSKSLISNVVTPQRDSLSPVLFTVYLEHALNEVRPTLPRPTIYIYIYIINGDLIALCPRLIESIDLKPFCHNYAKKHNFQLIK